MAVPPLRNALRRHPFRAVVAALVVAFAALNVLAYLHARAMLNFADGGSRTQQPQSLSLAQKAGVLLTGVRIPRPTNWRSPSDLALAFETHVVDVGEGVQIEIWSIPADEPRGHVILFHGYGGSKSSLLDEAQVFRELGFDTLLVDFRGSGGSTGSGTTIGYLEAEDIAAVVSFAQERNPGQPVVLYGQSMGAAAALRSIHACRVDVDGVIVEGVFDRLRTTIQNRFDLMGLPSFLAADLLVFWGGVQSGFRGFAHNPAEYALSCRCPAMMLHGEADVNARLDDARTVQRNLCNCTNLEVFPDAGHSSLLAADPERWRTAVATFLRESVDRSEEQRR